MNSHSPMQCPSCGALISGAPRGLCPSCVLHSLFGDLSKEMEESGPMEDLTGMQTECDRFGDYRILGEVARGGMGIVYRAEHVNLRRVVALKVISLVTSLHGQAERRFQAEAELIASLDHPHIVPIYETGQADGRPFYTMKFIDGEDLGRQLSARRWRNDDDAPKITSSDSSSFRTPFESRGAGARVPLLIAIVARAVHHAHERGILHRDLKPSNILIDQEGRPYVTDFGLAKRMDSDLPFTVSGEILGTPAYMAPEQTRGDSKQLTTAADVYSLGAILYHLLAGEPPFQGTPVQIINKVNNQEPVSPAAVDPQVDPDLAAICLKCLEKNPKRRYASALDLAEDLERWLRDEPIVARAAGRTETLRKWISRHPGWAAAVVVTCLAAISLLGLLGVSRQTFKSMAEAAQKSAREQRTLREQADTAQGRLSNHLLRLQVRAAEASFDRRDAAMGIARLAQLIREHPDQPTLVRRLIGAISTREVAQPEDRLSVGREVELMAFDSEGRLLAVATVDGTVQVWNLQTKKLFGPPLRHDSRITSLEFGSEGDLLATTADAGTHQKVRLWNVAAGELLLGPIRCDAGPVMLLAGPKRLVFPDNEEMFGGPPKSLYLGLRMFDLEAAAPVELPFDHSRMDKIDSVLYGLAVHPSGDYLVATTYWGFVHVFDPETRRCLFEPQKTPMIATRIAFEPDGKRFLIAGDRPEVLLCSLESGKVVDRLPHPEEVRDADWSADGELIATAALDGRVRLWKRENAFRVSHELQAGGQMRMVRFIGKSSQLLTVSADGTAKVWNIETGQPVLDGIRWNESFLADSDKGWAASAMDGTVHLWNLNQSREARFRELEHGFQKIHDVVFSPGGRVAITITGSSSIQGWHTDSGREAFPVTYNPTTLINSINFHSDEQRFLIAGSKVFLRHPERGMHTIDGLGSDAAFAGFVNGERQVLGVSDRGSMLLWNVDNLQSVTPGPNDLGFPVIGGDLDSSTEHLLIFGPSGAAAVRHWHSNTEVAPLPTGWTEDVVHGRFSSDDRYVVLVSAKGRCAVFEWRTGSPVREEFLQSLNTLSASFSPDSTRLLVVTSGGSAHIASVKHLDEDPVALAGSGFVSARFGPCGRRVVTAGRDWAARLWHAATGLPEWEPIWHSSPLYVAAISPSGDRLITGAFANAYHWKLPQFNLPDVAPDWLPAFAEAVAGIRIESEDRVETLSVHQIAQIFMETRNRSGQDFYNAWARSVLDPPDFR